MNFLFCALSIFVTTFGVNAAAVPASDSRPSTPPPRASNLAAFTTPERRVMAAAIKPSPVRPGKKPAAEAAIITTSNIHDSDSIGAPRELIAELVVTQRRPFVIICPFSRGKPPSLSAASVAEEAEEITHVILTPTHNSDHAKLVEINSIYQKSVEDGHESFLSRNYGSAAEFNAKISHLYTMYGALGGNYLQPLFYTMPEGFYDSESGTQRDPDFMSSITFSIIGILRKLDGGVRMDILGDIWLSHIDDSDAVCLSGTSERSTMVDLKHQSMGIGQTAVGIFNKYLVANWHGRETHLVKPKSATPEKSSLCFDGIVAYVEPSNFKSIGNNFRSHNFLIGAVNIEGKTEAENKPMLMFRAPSRICTPEHLAVDALKQQEKTRGSGSAAVSDDSDSPQGSSSEDEENVGSVKSNLFKLWKLVKSLYPSSKCKWQCKTAPLNGGTYIKKRRVKVHHCFLSINR